VNCSQAQVLLAAHRELNTDDVVTAELDAHLEQCPSCRNTLARYGLIGEQIRSLPVLEPSPVMHTKLMQALASEHSQFIQHSSSSVLPPPEFLKPYLRDHVHSSSKTDPLTAFSSADTGPLPIIRAVRKKRRRTAIGQFAVIGIAAVFLMTLMMGGITSLLLMAHDQAGNAPASSLGVIHPTDIAKISYTTTTTYNHVVSAVADQTSIYYTAYGNGTDNNWMLEQLVRATKVSTPLLATASASPLIVLGSTNDWLAWIQFDEPKITTHPILPGHTSRSLVRTWSLRYLSLIGPDRDTSVPNQPVTLFSGTFDQNAALSWIHTPIQGIWFIQNTLLVAMVDENGTSHLVRYPLGENNDFVPTEIAKASPDHIFTSPTANNDGTQIFWAEEWRSDDENLHSNIWTQQILDAPMPSHGEVARYKMTLKQLFLQNGQSFTPSVVNNALFLLSTADGAGLTQATSKATTPLPTSTGTAVPVSTPNTSTTPTASWANTNFYSAALDDSVRGTLVMYPLAGSLDVSPSLVSGIIGSASSLQAGKDFVLWQNGDGSYGMYDAVIKSNKNVGDVLNDAQFLAVNGDSAVWTIGNTGDTSSSSINPSTTLLAFSWPMK
jgi:hypothetical protein